MKTETGYRRPKTGIVAVVVLLTSCGRAEWHQADERLNFAAEAAREDGFVPMRGPHNSFGSFRDAGSTTWRLRLEPGRPYFIAAACAPSCDTLSFSVLDSLSTAALPDTSAGPAPRLVFTPTDGNLSVTITHGPCHGGRCRWIAQVYERRTAPQ